jgi:hypothetical protein
VQQVGDPIPDVDVTNCPSGQYSKGKCLPVPNEGINTSNVTTTTATSELMNQTGLINNNNSTEGDIIITEEGTSSPCIIIREEGTSSGPSRPQPQPTPSPKPC